MSHIYKMSYYPLFLAMHIMTCFFFNKKKIASLLALTSGLSGSYVLLVSFFLCLVCYYKGKMNNCSEGLHRVKEQDTK